ncbi:MAG TPA: protein kinase [Terracidiphilus sp.]|nr:protein kinase [Terracidiphilus sp.]
MNSEDWERSKELFSTAVTMRTTEREPFLQSQTDSSEVLEEVRSLLAIYRESPQFLDEPVSGAGVPGPSGAEEMGRRNLFRRLETILEKESQAREFSSAHDQTVLSGEGGDPTPPAEEDRPWDPIGPYKMLRRLGEGGMGIAYLAERDDGAYRQQVAIKVLKKGLNDPGLKRRFQNERQVLASLDHPYIARLIDGGTTTSGQPYYVMEYVDGEPVTRYAALHGLGLQERLKLFMSICEAVAAAHRQLVIHGDIKPGNILVVDDGSPRLLDFGLAHFLRPATRDVTTSLILLTPGYASPEQVRGERLSTVTDIYSLGVLLFELLTGESPYGNAATSPLELCRAICDHTPRKPSDAKATAIANPAPRLLRGDLDQIVLKALRKSPDERYHAVTDLRADVQRHLDGFPVEAARGSTLYHLRKFVLRRRWYVAAGGVFLLLAGLAIWRIWRAEQIAEQRFGQVRQLAHAMIFDVHDAIEDLPGSTAARKTLVESTLKYLKALEATSGRNRDLDLELARAYTKVGAVQAAAGRASLDDCAAGVQNLEHARDLLKEVLVRSSTDEEAVTALVDADVAAAEVHARRGEMSQWRILRAEAAILLEDMAKRHPGDRRLALRCLLTAATTIDGEHDHPAALAAYQQVMTAARAAPPDSEIRLIEARTERDIAEELQALGNNAAALDHQRASLSIFQDLVAAAPANTRFRMETSWTYAETAWLEHEFHDEPAALADFDKGMALLRAISAVDPGNQLARLEIGKLEMTSSETVELALSPRQAAEDLRDAISIFAAELRLDPTNDDARVHLAQSEFNYGALLTRMARGDCSAGVEAYRQSLAAASAVKDDYSATSVFDMRKLRAALLKRLSSCHPGDLQ